MPGQTYDSWIATLDEVYSSGFIPRTYPFLLLRNAPATYDVAYREKFGIKDGLAFEVLDTILEGSNIQEIVNDTINNYKIHQIVECNTPPCVLRSHCGLKGILDQALESFYQLKVFSLNECL